MKPRRVLTALLLSAALAGIADVRAQPTSGNATNGHPTNQNLFDTEPYLPEHYAERVARFESQPVRSDRIIFLGNSITEGGNWAALTGDSTVVNRGISGDVSFGVLERLDDITRRRPSKLFVMIGVNDIGKDIPEAVIANNVRKAIEEVQEESPHTQIFVQSVLPVDPAYPNFPQHYDKEHQIIRLNRLLRNVAAESNVKFVNLYPLFLDNVGWMEDRFTSDGLHLSPAGYELWVDYLKQNGYL